MIRRFLLVSTLSFLPGVLTAQNFSCGYGSQPACLDYGDKICSSRGKCVDSDAACFEPYQCNYEGFTCKSNLTDCANEYEDLLQKHNDLVDDYNDLLARAKRRKSIMEEVADCIRYANSISDAQSCAYSLD